MLLSIAKIAAFVAIASPAVFAAPTNAEENYKSLYKLPHRHMRAAYYQYTTKYSSHKKTTKKHHYKKTTKKTSQKKTTTAAAAKTTTKAATKTTTKAAATAKPTSTNINSSSSSGGDVQQQALTSHNAYRAKHHVAGLSWDQKLADHAASVVKTCVWGHSVMSGTGQNIAYGYPSMTAVVDAWYDEVKDYDYNSGTSINGATTGHFTQVVWKGTTSIGCASNYCSNLGGTYYVCDYSPPGNYGGEYTANVFKP